MCVRIGNDICDAYFDFHVVLLVINLKKGQKILPLIIYKKKLIENFQVKTKMILKEKKYQYKRKF